MKARLLKKIVMIASVGALALAVMSGCTASGGTQLTEEQQANRDYMAQVSQTMDDLNEPLDNFSEAASRNDLVNMRTQSDKALSIIEDFSTVEAPEALQEIDANYKDGLTKISQSLDGYVTLYTEIESSSDAHPFDWSTYDDRLAGLQTLYDDGFASLKAGDDAAAALE